jgi:hypothetical protein
MGVVIILWTLLSMSFSAYPWYSREIASWYICAPLAQIRLSMDNIPDWHNVLGLVCLDPLVVTITRGTSKWVGNPFLGTTPPQSLGNNLTICRINVNTCKYGDLLQLLGVSSCDAEQVLDVRYCKCYVTVEDLPWNGYPKDTMAALNRIDFSTPENRNQHQVSGCLLKPPRDAS